VVAESAVITGVASYLPDGQLTNDMIVEHFGDWTAEKIETKTGIRSRHMADEAEFTSDMAVSAAEALFAQDPRHREDIDLVVLTTVTPDYIVPITAGMVQDRLGLPTSTGAFDVTLGCSGYVYGLSIATAFIESGRARKVMLVTSDRFTICTEKAPQQVRTIFGDGATATLLEAESLAKQTAAEGPPRRIFGRVGGIELGTDGSGAPRLMVPTSASKGWVGAETSESGWPEVYMEGSEVFDFTLRTIAPRIRSFLSNHDLGVEDVDHYIFHQANMFMLEHMRRRLKIQPEQFVVRMEDVGNTISTSIPLALDTAISKGEVKPGARILCVGFGTGYSWGSVLLEAVD